MITPIYESTNAKVFCGDALEVLPQMETESFDLVVTDPPYGVAWQSNLRTEKFAQLINDGSSAEERAGIAGVLRQTVRLVGQNRHLYVFGPTDVLDGLKVGRAVELIWDKARPGAGDVTAPWAPAHERITFAVSKHRHAGQTGSDGVPPRIRKGSVLRFAPPTGRQVRHPSEKPVGLLRELIESSSRQGELVLDPFAGSGSTGVAAVLAGRRATLVEMDPAMAQMCVARVQRAEAAVATLAGC